MTLPLPVRLSRNAQAQIEEAAAWWEKNRPSAPGAVREDIDRILALLAAQPDIGARARGAKLKTIRRVTLSRIRYYLFYRVTGEALEVLAFWHTSRGRPPPL